MIKGCDMDYQICTLCPAGCIITVNESTQAGNVCGYPNIAGRKPLSVRPVKHEVQRSAARAQQQKPAATGTNEDGVQTDDLRYSALPTRVADQAVMF